MTTAPLDSDFVDSLDSHNLFMDVFDTSLYSPLPRHWLIVATDIKGSTKAIQQGRYKDVNTLGASSIISAINACSHDKICFQFGGDGALIAAPPQHLEALNQALNELKLIAQTNHSLDLRVSIWTVQDFLDKGYDFNVLKHDIAPKSSVFMFQGSGVEASDLWLKQSPQGTDLFVEDALTPLSLKFVEGLECRWNPLQSHQGSMVTGLIKSRSEKPTVEIMSQIHKIIDEKKLENHPLSLASLVTRWPPKHYTSEWRTKTAGQPWPKKYLTYFAVMLKLLLLTPIVWMFKAKIPYLADLINKSDFQKFDGMYRFVRDLSPEQTKQLKDLCKRLYQEGEIFYGLHESPTALMTCMVFTEENHLHFIDGNDGGYAMAATQLKAQIKKKSTATGTEN